MNTPIIPQNSNTIKHNDSRFVSGVLLLSEVLATVTLGDLAVMNASIATYHRYEYLCAAVPRFRQILRDLAEGKDSLFLAEVHRAEIVLRMVPRTREACRKSSAGWGTEAEQ
jgi:hypothetical protein